MRGGRGGADDGRSDRGSSGRASHIGGGGGNIAGIAGGCDGILEMKAEVVMVEVVKLASEKWRFR